jgi:mono/diheme cytochrome c family protein
MSMRSCIVTSLLVLCACATTRGSEPVRGPLVVDSAEEQQGQVVFMRECNYCHPMGDGGLGPALNNKPLPKAPVKLQIRKGLGAMPAFSEQQLSDAEVDAIFAYMLVLRRHD